MPNEKRPRWKLLAIMLAAPIVGWFVLKQLPKVIEAGAGGALDLLIVMLVLGLGLTWLMLFSRLPWLTRWIGFGVVGLGAAVIKIDGHTGGFFPQFSFRWSKHAAEARPDLVGKVAEEGVLIETEGPEHFPRFLGPEMNNWVAGELLGDQWYASEPKQLWRKQIGEGWSSFSVAGGFAFTMEQRGEEEVTVCYELATGDAVWVHAEAVRFEESMGDDGPRSTPTVTDGMVFAMGATGILNCHDARTGALIWGKDVLAEAGQEVPMWAKSCSPLVVGDRVIVTLGKKAEKNLAAYDVGSGELVWRAGDYSASYASPVFATLAGRQQVVAIQAKSVDGYDIESGEILWSFPIGNPQGNCASPLIVGDTVITSGGYGYGTHRIEIVPTADGFVAEELWRSRKLKAKFADMVVRGEHLYGLDEGRLVCLSLEDGERVWRGTNFGHGQILGVGDHLIVQAEKGNVTIVEANPDGEEIVLEFDALDRRTWNHPVLAGNILLVRNDREAIAFEFPER
ncbi:MAG: outer membrane protein assembly factor BamB [Pseudoalteromonas tetraodonis]|jgi:outer membrane protein assembly factor BamB